MCKWMNVVYEIWDVFGYYFSNKNYFVPFPLFSFCYILYVFVELGYIYVGLPEIVLPVSEILLTFLQSFHCFFGLDNLIALVQAY